MKKLLLVLVLLPTMLLSQNSWINIQLMTDDFPNETSWQITPEYGTPIIIGQDPAVGINELYDTTIAVQGFFIASIFDSYGDGLGASQWNGTDGWFLIQNDCQDTIMYVAGDFGVSYIDTLNIAPCAPPVMGCIDPIATNYDSTATADDGGCLYVLGCMDPIAVNYDSLATQMDFSCTYIVGCTNTNATNYDSLATASYYTGQVASGGSCSLSQWTQNYFGIDSATYYNDPSIFTSGTQIFVDGNWYWIDGINFTTDCNAPAVLIYVVGSEAACDGNIYTFELNSLQTDVPVGTTWYITPCIYNYGCTNPLAFNYDSLAGVDNGTCEFIEGCTDSTSVNYNPIATMDDNSCIGGGIICTAGKTEVTIQIKLDQFTGETGWILSEVGVGIIEEVLPNTYGGYPPGAIITYTTCIDNGTTIEFLINDTYGDGIYAPGGWIVYTDCDTISAGGEFGNNLAIQDFGYSYSETGTVNPCLYNTITGCMDPSYLEFNPLANQMDSALCLTSVVYGCNDLTAFNYDSTATGLQQNPGCDNILTLTDWAGDGWSGAFLYVTQGSNYYGPFTVDSTTFVDTITLNTTQQVNVFFYSYGQSQSTSEQCMFTITNPLGNIILEVGANPYTNPIASYNQFSNMYSVYADCGDICIDRVYGCINPIAFNYDSLANTTDGSCYYLPGCTDAAYLQYHTQGYVADYNDSTCTDYANFGCMDTNAFNYNSLATVNWTSVLDQTDPCIAKVFGCTDPLAFNYNALANTEDYTCQAVVNGCLDQTQFNYNPLANTDNNTCIPFAYGCTDSTALNYDVLANTDNSGCIAYLYGCTDSLAINYNPLANTDDGSCIITILGCTSPIAFNYDPSANADDGSCTPFIYGCTDNTQFNFNPLANTDDLTCIPIVNGCTDATMWNYEVSANTDNGSCLPYIYGCTDNTQFNYNPLANTDNNSCIPVINGCTDSLSINYNALANTNDNSCVPFIYGCTDATAINFNPLANTNDGTCIPTIYGCTDSTAINYNSLANVDDLSCIPFIYGCTDPTMFNYDINANTDDNSCIPYIYGCMDILAFNYNPLANTDNNSCIAEVLGCMEATALNFDPLANTEYTPSNCILPVSGCTEVSAFNYNPLANTSDSTACLYEAIGCVTGLGAPYGTGFWLNDGCFAWVIDVDDYCCTTDWDASCQSMYDYCQLGWPTSIEDISSMGIVVYPNPTGDVLNIDTRLDVEVEIYDMIGKLMTKEKSKRINLSDYPTGVYNLILIYNNKRFNTRVIKQ